MILSGLLLPMDERIRRRRRSVKWERGRGRRTALFLASVMVLGVVAFFSLRSTDVFAVKRIVAVGADQVTREQIEDLTRGVMGESMLSLSTRSIEEGLLALPYVSAVRVHRSFPNTLEIDVLEHRPVARLQTTAGAIWVVGDDGRVLEAGGGPQFAALPLLLPDSSFRVELGEVVPAAVANVLPLAVMVGGEGLCSQLPALAGIAVSTGGCVTLVLEDGGELRLGAPDRLDQKIGVALGIVRQCVAQGRVIEYVDASVVDRVAVKAK